MKFFERKAAVLAVLFFIFTQTTALAAGSILTGVRYSSVTEYERIVFDFNRLTRYRVTTSDKGRHIVFDFAGVSANEAQKTPVRGDAVERIRYEEKNGHLFVHIYLTDSVKYRIDELKNPHRVFIDILRDTDTKPQKIEQPAQDTDSAFGKNASSYEFAPGLTATVYKQRGAEGNVTAYFVEADKSSYTVRPVLGRGIVPGRQTLSGIVNDTGTLAAVNASYFAPDGEIIGVTKIDGLITGTTYYTRSAFGIMPDGSAVFGKIAYSGLVTLGDVSLPVAGVNAERGKDNLVVYNRLYGNSTRTNEYGTEYVIQNDTVVDIGVGDTPIPDDGVVVSVHGAAEAAFAGVEIGDPAVVYEPLGEPWDEAEFIVGVGPRLLENGKVHVTAAEEEMPPDIRYGRAPRSAVGVKANGNFVLAVVDGRQAISRGCTLTEWAELLKKFGVTDAINLDGGGSSEIIADGEILNSPSDGSERPLGNALIITKK